MPAPAALWAKLVKIIKYNYDNFDGFVILHGTDTMAYTASALSFMLENLSKPVILTGSQLPIGMLRTDGKENLITSIEIAAAKHPNGTAIVPEVCIFFENHLLRGNRTTKINAENFNAFRYCTPMEMRLKPARRSRVSMGSVTESGLASSETSASRLTSKRRSISANIFASPPAPKNEGVPPPK